MKMPKIKVQENEHTSEDPSKTDGVGLDTRRKKSSLWWLLFVDPRRGRDKVLGQGTVNDAMMRERKLENRKQEIKIYMESDFNGFFFRSSLYSRWKMKSGAKGNEKRKGFCKGKVGDEIEETI